MYNNYINIESWQISAARQFAEEGLSEEEKQSIRDEMATQPFMMPMVIEATPKTLPQLFDIPEEQRTAENYPNTWLSDYMGFVSSYILHELAIDVDVDDSGHILDQVRP